MHGAFQTARTDPGISRPSQHHHAMAAWCRSGRHHHALAACPKSGREVVEKCQSPLPSSAVPCMGSVDCLLFRNTFSCEPLPGSKVAPNCSSHFFICMEFTPSRLNTSVAFVNGNATRMLQDAWQHLPSSAMPSLSLQKTAMRDWQLGKGPDVNHLKHVGYLAAGPPGPIPPALPQLSAGCQSTPANLHEQKSPGLRGCRFFVLQRTLTNQSVEEREGFEPSEPCGSPDFESGTFDHSATSPDHRRSWVNESSLGF